MKTSITDESISKINITKQNIVCRIISVLTFSLRLSLTIDLYNLKQLTHIANITGIIIIFCSNKLLSPKTIPFPVPKATENAEIVYPKQKPLYIITPNTIGIPN